jgi:hypothetical protein
MSETAIQAISESSQLTGLQVLAQVNLIQQVLGSVMKEDEHFGVIPGTTKPTLYKAGAEKLCLTFRLSPTYKVERIEHGNGHREYIVTAQLTHIPTGNVWGEGVGSCSTLEKKYRYRNDYEPTGKQVPKAYWTNRDASLLGGKGFIAKKDENGIWMIFASSGQTENPDLAEQYNTVLKMAKKRALTDATLSACAASDIFTQDLDDNFDEYNRPPAKPVQTDQEKFEKARGITPKPETEPAPEMQTAQPPTETPEAKAKRELGEKRAAFMNRMPDDIQNYFRAFKGVGKKIGEWFQIVADNQEDVEQIRGYMKDHPLTVSMKEIAESIMGGGENIP